MKINTILLIAAFCLIASIFTKAKHKNALKYQITGDEDQKNLAKIETKPVHINDMMIGNPNNMIRDRSPLWKDFKNNKFDRPFMHGVVGPQWRVPTAEDSNGFNIISSPMPKPELSTRVIAKDLPPRTYSPTAFDLPLRKDVIQTQIPTSVTRTVETSIDPRNPPKRPVAKVSGTLYHGTGSTDAKVVHGIETNFLEKKNNKKKGFRNYKLTRKGGKKINCKNKDFLFTDTKRYREEGLKHSRNAYDTSSAVLGSITNGAVDSPYMILDVKVTNKREQPDLKLHEENPTRRRRLESLRKTPAGVRAAHTLRRFS